MLMRGKEKLLGLVYACGYLSELLSLWIHYYFCLTGLVVFLGWGVVGVGGFLDPSPAPAPHLYITNHLTSLTSFKTMFNIVYELASFKTMFNIVYELASYKTIICSRGGWW